MATKHVLTKQFRVQHIYRVVDECYNPVAGDEVIFVEAEAKEKAELLNRVYAMGYADARISMNAQGDLDNEVEAQRIRKHFEAEKAEKVARELVSQIGVDPDAVMGYSDPIEPDAGDSRITSEIDASDPDSEYKPSQPKYKPICQGCGEAISNCKCCVAFR